MIEKEAIMKKTKTLISLFVFFMLFPVLYGCLGDETYTVKNAFITIDINPSIEIITGDDGLVSEVNALNDDAEILLYGTNFSGKGVQEVAEAIMELGTELGYLDSNLENAIIITAAAENNDESSKLELKLERKLQRFASRKKIRLEIIKASHAASEELLQQANELGISVGKLKLITFAIALNENLTLEETAKMSVRDLTAIIKAARKECRLYKEELKDQFFEIKERLKIKLFKEKVRLINNYIQEAEANIFGDFVTDLADVDTIKATYQKYSLGVLTFILTEEEVPANLEDVLTQMEKLQEIFKELLEKKDELINNWDDEAFKEIKEQIKAIKNELKEARQNANGIGLGQFRFNHQGFNFENKPRFQIFRELMKFRERYVEEFQSLGINLDELEDLILEKISEEVQELKNALDEEFQVKKEELKVNADNYKENLEKKNKQMREANKMKNENNKRKGRD